MNDQILFDLIRNALGALVLVKTNGEIICVSKRFKSLISDVLPYESNVLEMLMHSSQVQPELLYMYKNNYIDSERLPDSIQLKENFNITITCQSEFSRGKNNLLLLKFETNAYLKNQFIDDFIKSRTLFLDKVIPSLVYSNISAKVIAINRTGSEFLKDYWNEEDLVLQDFNNEVEKLAKKTRIGGLASSEKEINLNGTSLYLKFECSILDEEHNYIFVTFEDVSFYRRKDELLKLEKDRAHSLIEVVPGVLFEFEVIEDKLNFTYMSESIKDLVGLSSEHVIKDSNLLFSHFNRMERARLHYFFTSLSEKDRKIRNEFKINDGLNNAKWVTIDWHESYSSKGMLKGTGYLNDISDKKKANEEKQKLERRRTLIEYFSLVLLRQPTIALIINDLAKSLVRKLNLQDVLIYLYNSNSRNLEFGAFYSEYYKDNARVNHPKLISSEDGIIGRVVRTQEAIIINNTSEDKDYYFIDKPSESEITVPILFEGELLGVIDSENIRPDFFTEDHLDMLKDVADNLAVRLVQKKRQDDNLKFHSTLNSLYQQGKIFDFRFNFETNRLDNSSVDHFIDLIGILDKSEKIRIFENSNVLIKYILDYDIGIINNFMSSLKRGKKTEDKLMLRMITLNGKIKWLKFSISQILKSNSDLIAIEGTIQDISTFKELEQRNKGFESLLSSINLSQSSLVKDKDFYKSLGIIGNRLGVSRVVISQFNINNDILNFTDMLRWVQNEDLYQGDDKCMLNEFEDFDYKEVLANNYYYDISEIPFTEKQSNFLNKQKITSLLGFPLKTNKGLWGILYFIEESKERKWKEYEKNLLSGFANFVATLIQNKKLIDDLITSNKRVIEETKLKSVYINTMSHEIRTPLNGIIGSLEMLNSTNLSNDQVEWLNTISSSSNLLLSTVNKVLSQAKIESGNRELLVSKIDMCGLVDSLKRVVAYYSVLKKIDIICLVDDSVPDFIEGDELYIKQIFNNLIGNAVKFTESGEIVLKVRVEEIDNNRLELIVLVIDNGRGIPKNKVEYIFTDFEQAHSVVNKGQEGTGLGLSITKKLVEMMEGSISVSSAVGKGTSFQFSILVNAVDSKEATVNNAHFKDKKVLILFSNKNNNISFENFVKRKNFFGKTANNIYDADKELKLQSFDVFILDDLVDGYEDIITQVSQNYPNTKVLLYSFAIKKKDIFPNVENMLMPIIFEDVSNQLLATKGKEDVTANDSILLGNKNILLVEDDPVNQLLTRKMLEVLSAKNIDIANDGLEALSLVDNKKYDVIFMDIRMPNMDGYESTIAIRNKKLENYPIIIALTAEAFEKDKNKSLESGMDDFLSKPVKLETLNSVLLKHLSL